MRKLIAIATGLAVACPLAADAQANVGAAAAQTVQVVQTRQQNAALARQYTWNERTELTKDGQVKDVRIDFVSYAPDGTLQRSLLNDQSAPLPRGFLRRSIAEGERKDMEKYLTGLRGLIEKYALPTAGAVLNYLDSAATMPAPGNQLQIAGANVVQPGDSLTIWVDATTKKTKRMAISTTFQGDPVSVSASFNTLPSGLNYMAWAEVSIPSKSLGLLVQNFDYVRSQ